jgi:hypothetical protein
VVLVIERRIGIAGGNQIVAAVAPQYTAAARAVADALLATLLRYTGWLLGISLVVIVVALLTGPYAWAVATRRAAVDLARTIAGAARPGTETPTAAWVAAHRDLVMLGAAVLGIATLLFLDLSLFWSIIVIAVVAGVEVLAWRAAMAPPASGEPS